MSYPKLQTKQEWFESFRTTQTYADVLRYAQKYSEEYSRSLKPEVNLNNRFIEDKQRLYILTPRERAFATKVLVVDSFRILEYIDTNGKHPIYDIGCGMNLFANFYDIVGMDIRPVDPLSFNRYQRIDPFNHSFIKKHEEQLPSAIAINSLHFIHIKDTRQTILDFAKVIKPSGLGYITFNLEMIYENTPPEYLEEHNLYTPSVARKFFDDVVGSLDLEVLDYENKIENFLTSYYDSVDGTVRILFAKHSR